MTRDQQQRLDRVVDPAEVGRLDVDDIGRLGRHEHFDVLERVAPLIDGDAHVAATTPKARAQGCECSHLRVPAPRVDDMLNSDREGLARGSRRDEIVRYRVDIAAERLTDCSVHVERAIAAITRLGRGAG